MATTHWPMATLLESPSGSGVSGLPDGIHLAARRRRSSGRRPTILALTSALVWSWPWLNGDRHRRGLDAVLLTTCALVRIVPSVVDDEAAAERLPATQLPEPARRAPGRSTGRGPLQPRSSGRWPPGGSRPRAGERGVRPEPAAPRRRRGPRRRRTRAAPITTSAAMPAPAIRYLNARDMVRTSACRAPSRAARVACRRTAAAPAPGSAPGGRRIPVAAAWPRLSSDRPRQATRSERAARRAAAVAVPGRRGTAEACGRV